jgi:hypothetical protein
MSKTCYYQYAFARPNCRIERIGPGVDGRFGVELLSDGHIAAVTSRVGLDRFDPERLQGRSEEEVRWVAETAARHNAIICEAADGSPVLPLRLGVVFQSRESLLATLARWRAVVTRFFEQFGDRQEWGVKLYLSRPRLAVTPAHAGAPAPHCLATATSGTDYLQHKRAELDCRRTVQAAVQETVRSVEQSLAERAEQCRRLRPLPGHLTGRNEEMVFNAAFLLPSAAGNGWLEAVQRVGHDVNQAGLCLELSGPWPLYHFCPSLES